MLAIRPTPTTRGRTRTVIRRPVRAVLAAAVTGVGAAAVSAVLAVPAWADGPGGANGLNVAGGQTANKWPLIQTLGVFAGLPLLATVVIVALVLGGPIIRSGRAGGGVAAFSGPHAGPVDAGDPASTGDFSDHRAPAETGANDAERADDRLAEGAAKGHRPGRATPGGPVTEAVSDTSAETDRGRGGQGGAGATW